MKMRIKERIAAVLTLAVFVSVFINSQSIPKIPSMFPKGISILGILLSAILLIKTFVGRYQSDSEVLVEEKDQKQATKQIGGSIAMLLAYVMLIRVIGFYTISFVFLNAFAYFNDTEKHKLWTYPVVAGSVLVVIYLIFTCFLKVRLPDGLLF